VGDEPFTMRFVRCSVCFELLRRVQDVQAAGPSSRRQRRNWLCDARSCTRTCVRTAEPRHRFACVRRTLLLMQHASPSTSSVTTMNVVTHSTGRSTAELGRNTPALQCNHRRHVRRARHDRNRRWRSDKAAEPRVLQATRIDMKPYMDAWVQGRRSSCHWPHSAQTSHC